MAVIVYTSGLFTQSLWWKSTYTILNFGFYSGKYILNLIIYIKQYKRSIQLFEDPLILKFMSMLFAYCVIVLMPHTS